jgi:hypothetical protein
MADIFVMTDEMMKMDDKVQSLTGIFGDKAKIERQGLENEFIVTTILEDGITRGGQGARFVLKHQNNILGMENMPESDDVFLCRKIEINGIDLTPELPECYFVPRYYISNQSIFSNDPSIAVDWQTLEVNSQNPENNRFIMHYFMQIGTFAGITPNEDARRVVVLRVFTNSDDFVALLHEGAHAAGGEIQDKAGKVASNLHNIVNEMNNNEKWAISKFALEIWKRVVRGEAEADARVIQWVKKLKKEGNDIFPGEEDELFGIRKFIQLQLQPYIDVCDKKFSNSVSAEELDELLNLSHIEL